MPILLKRNLSFIQKATRLSQPRAQFSVGRDSPPDHHASARKPRASLSANSGENRASTFKRYAKSYRNLGASLYARIMLTGKVVINLPFSSATTLGPMHSAFMKDVLKTLLCLALLQTGFATAESAPEQAGAVAPSLSEMSPEQKKQAQAYFRAHAFAFSTLFSSHHPGPYWILENAKAFQLSSAQTQQQEALKTGMAKRTLAASAKLQQAYDQYARDAAEMNPSLARLNADIAAIGKAQTRLAQVMIPYHLKAYAALNSEQQAIYRQKVAQSDPSPKPAAGGPTLEQRFARLDADNDGAITWEEALPSRERDFDALDKNHDDRVTPDEFTGTLPFARFDANKDGALSKAEFVETHHAMFMKFDADGDKRISPSEFATAQRAAGK